MWRCIEGVKIGSGNKKREGGRELGGFEGVEMGVVWIGSGRAV
jgi:hypothetical protein